MVIIFLQTERGRPSTMIFLFFSIGCDAQLSYQATPKIVE
jgi:hypothetical protein